MTKIVRKDFIMFRNYLLVQRGSVKNYNSEQTDVKNRHEQFRENVERADNEGEKTSSV